MTTSHICLTPPRFRFRLIHAVKPHTDRVCNVVTCTSYSLIVTLSEDKTIFFFKFESSDKGVHMKPIRSVTIPEIALNIQFLTVHAGGRFHQNFTHSFYARRSRRIKITNTKIKKKGPLEIFVGASNLDFAKGSR